MKLSRFPVGCRRAENLFQLARGLLAGWSLDAVDLGVALPCFRIDREFDFSHVVPLRV
jgi:hypothetical protein